MNPVGDRIFVKVQVADVRSTGGLVLPSSAQKSSTQGEVTTVSKGCSLKVQIIFFLDTLLVILKVGDHVVYGEYSGTDITIDGAPHVLLKEEDVIGLMQSKAVSELKPLGDRILVEISESEEATSAGLLLTASVQEKPTFGKVLIFFLSRLMVISVGFECWAWKEN